MNKEQLKDRMNATGCSLTDAKTAYSPNLVRCGCAGGGHALAAVACGNKADEPVKLLASAVSWHIASGRSGPLTYVLGRDAGDKYKHAIYALGLMRRLASVEVDLQLDFEPVSQGERRDLADHHWVKRMLEGGHRQLPEFGKLLEELANPPRFRWYRSVTGSEWSGRLDGLQVCELRENGPS